MVNDSQRMSPYSATYQVRGSSTYDIDYKTSALRGRVLDAGTNEPLANVSVQLRSTSSNEGPRMTRGGLSDATGAFLLDAIPPGSYSLTATKDGYGNEVKELYVGDSPPQDLELHLGRNLGVTLNVVDARDNQPITARASVYDMQGRIVDETRMMFGGGGESGVLKLSVSPGNYTATVSAGGYASRNVSFPSPSTQTVALSPGGTLQVRSKHSSAVRIRLIDANGIPYWRFRTLPAPASCSPAPTPRPSPTSHPAPTRCSSSRMRSWWSRNGSWCRKDRRRGRRFDSAVPRGSSQFGVPRRKPRNSEELRTRGTLPTRLLPRAPRPSAAPASPRQLREGGVPVRRGGCRWS